MMPLSGGRMCYLSELSQLHDDPYGGVKAQTQQLDDVWMVKLLHDPYKTHTHSGTGQRVHFAGLNTTFLAAI